MIPLLLNLALFSPSDVVLAGLSNGVTTQNVKNTTKDIGFQTSASGFKLTSVKLFGSSGTSTVGFTLKDSGGNTLASGGSYLNVSFVPAGVDLAFGLDLPNYELAANTSYTLSMAFSSGSGGNLYLNDAGTFQAANWTQNTSPGIKYSMYAAVPEPGTLLMGTLLALFGAGVWWWRFYV